MFFFSYSQQKTPRNHNSALQTLVFSFFNFNISYSCCKKEIDSQSVGANLIMFKILNPVNLNLEFSALLLPPTNKNKKQ